ncbi:MAG: hypothetical protein ACTSWX_14780 [Promethearchaeota archaeon]
MPQNGSGVLTMEAASMYQMENLSHLMDLPSMLISDSNTHVDYSNSTDFLGTATFDIGFLAISGDMRVFSDFLNESFYNFTDTFTINFYINDYKFDSIYIANASDYVNLTNFWLPLNWMGGEYVDFEIEIVFDAAPSNNINETEMGETIQDEIDAGIDMVAYPRMNYTRNYTTNTG